MNIEEITIKEAREIASFFNGRGPYRNTCFRESRQRDGVRTA